MKALLSLIRDLVGRLHMHIANIPCAKPFQVDVPYGPAQRGECRDRRIARANELREAGVDERDVLVAHACADVEFCDRCKALDGIAHAVEPLQRMQLKGWPTEWPEWQGKK